MANYVPPTCPSVYPSIHLPIHLSYLSVYVCLACSPPEHQGATPAGVHELQRDVGGNDVDSRHQRGAREGVVDQALSMYVYIGELISESARLGGGEGSAGERDCRSDPERGRIVCDV